MLMKPRRWLAYTIELNDLLPNYEEILDRFERSDIPLDGTFGSSSIWTKPSIGLLIAIAPAVEPERLAEVLDLVNGSGQIFLIVHDDPSHNKVILVGALNLQTEAFVALSDDLMAVIKRPGATADDLVKAITVAPKIQPMPRREEQP